MSFLSFAAHHFTSAHPQINPLCVLEHRPSLSCTGQPDRREPVARIHASTPPSWRPCLTILPLSVVSYMRRAELGSLLAQVGETGAVEQDRQGQAWADLGRPRRACMCTSSVASFTRHQPRQIWRLAQTQTSTKLQKPIAFTFHESYSSQSQPRHVISAEEARRPLPEMREL